MAISDWEKLKELGRGGQGVVHLVARKDSIPQPEECETLLREISGQIIPADIAERAQRAKNFRELILRIAKSESPENRGALKELHTSTDARNADAAADRVQREIVTMESNVHPNLLKIIDAGPNWYVSEFHAPGSLSDNREMFKGDVRSATKAIRGLAEGVASLHRSAYVHRDIKPDNVFIADDGSLILGDFGLTILADDTQTRLTRTDENVGTWDWMPQWAMDKRVEDITPQFDVYALGKLFWAMISGKPRMHLWYFDRDDANLETQFPDKPEMKGVNEILRSSVVEDQENTLEDAFEFIDRLDHVFGANTDVDIKPETLADDDVRKCLVCRSGVYALQRGIHGQGEMATNLGLVPRGSRDYGVFSCRNCGHVQLFLRGGSMPPAWDEPSTN